MRNTDYNLDALGSFLSSEASFQALKDMISDFDLEFQAVNPL